MILFLFFPLPAYVKYRLVKIDETQGYTFLRLKDVRSSVAEVQYYKYQNITLSKERVVTFKKKCNFAHKNESDYINGNTF